MPKKIIYYYQTFVGLNDILNNSNNGVTHIHLSSIHFGLDETNKTQYIHLNNNIPYDKVFDSVWNQLNIAKKQGIKVILMVGGAGGAFQTLFSDFETYYSLLKELILNKKDIIDGIDLDIEEFVRIEDVERVIRKIKADFGEDFIISMAPVQYSLETDTPGMGGFVYKDLYLNCGNLIDYFNVQCYSSYSFNSYNDIIKNGFPQEKIIIGSISNQDINNNLKVVKQIVSCYPNFGGVFNWEYYDSPPDPNNHDKWASLMYSAIYQT